MLRTFAAVFSDIKFFLAWVVYVSRQPAVTAGQPFQFGYMSSCVTGFVFILPRAYALIFYAMWGREALGEHGKRGTCSSSRRHQSSLLGMQSRAHSTGVLTENVQ